MLNYELRAAPPEGGILSLLLGCMEPDERAWLTIETGKTDRTRLYATLDTQREINHLICDALQNNGYAPILQEERNKKPLNNHYAIVRRIGQDGTYGVIRDAALNQVMSALCSMKAHLRLTIYFRVLQSLSYREQMFAQRHEERLIRANLRSQAMTSFYQAEPALVEMCIMVAAEWQEDARNINAMLTGAFGIEMDIVPLENDDHIDQCMKTIDAHYMSCRHPAGSYLTYGAWYSLHECRLLEKGLSMNMLFPNVVPEAVQRTNIDSVYLERKEDFIPLGVCAGKIVGIVKSALLRGLAILGKSGMGKTNVILQLIEQLCNMLNASALFITPIKRDGRKIQKNVDIYTIGGHESPLYINPVLPLDENMSMNHHRDLLVQTFVETFSSGDPSSADTMSRLFGDAVDIFLLKAGYQIPAADIQTVKDGHPDMLTIPNLFDAVKAAMKMKNYKADIGKNLETVLLSRLHEMTRLPCFETDRHNVQMHDLIRPGHVTILELEDMPSSYGKRLITTCVINNIMKNIEMMPRDHQVYVVLDESHTILLDEQLNPTQFLFNLVNAMNEDRGRGIGYILADQDPARLTSHIIHSCSSVITFACENETMLSGPLFSNEPPLLPINSLPETYAYLRCDGKPAVVFQADKHEDRADNGIDRQDHTFLPFAGCEKYCSTCRNEDRREGRRHASCLHAAFLKHMDKKKPMEEAAKLALGPLMIEDNRLSHCARCHLLRELVKYGVPAQLFDRDKI